MQPHSSLSHDHQREPLQVEQRAPGVGMCGASRRQLGALQGSGKVAG